MLDLHELSKNAREAFYSLSVSDSGKRNKALLHLAELLEKEADDIFEANREDLLNAEMEGLSKPLLHRLKFGVEKNRQVCDGLRALSSLPDQKKEE